MNKYKNTLNLPNTKFPMKANLVKKEIDILNNWNKGNLYSRIRSAKKNRKLFILHDGPPYANGNIHIGHAMNKIIKDIIIKSKSLGNYNAPYIPGWDCHGLPIEHVIEKNISQTKKKLLLSDFRKFCRQYANIQVNKQKEEFIRLGVIADWNNPYLTMDYPNEANIIRVLIKIIKKGYLYRECFPVYWCVKCQSSLAEAEVEYCNKISLSADILFKSIDVEDVLFRFGIHENRDFKSIYCVAWSTALWTIPANSGLCVHPNLNYILLLHNNYGYIISENSLSDFIIRVNIKNYSVVENVCVGKKLEFLYFFHPFLDNKVPLVLSDHVNLYEGNAIVHIAPNYGLDDYLIGKKYKLKSNNIIDSYGNYLFNVHYLLNELNIFDANNDLLEIFYKKNILLHSKEIKHSYPYCWRHKYPVIFFSTYQWFINLEKNNLRKKILKEIENVIWLPTWAKNNMLSMVSKRPNWCISRQRNWGVPIPLFINKNTGDLHPNTIDLMKKVADLVELNGVDIWWEIDYVKIFNINEEEYIKIIDILDVWFDSGATVYSVLSKRKEFNSCFADVYFEGSDQHRGWFMSSLIISMIINNRSPYHQVLTHGFVVDSLGHKMSKSLGNIIEPSYIINKFGADILRLCIAYSDYFNEISISNDILNTSISIYRRIRNTIRFLLANLNNFDPKIDIVDKCNMLSLDKWIIYCIKKLQNNIIDLYNNYNFHDVVKKLVHFCSIDMGSFYLDIIKDRRYTLKSDNIANLSCQTTIYYILEVLVRCISPILSFTADEIWKFLPGKRTEYIFTETWINIDDNYIVDDGIWNILLEIRNEINKIIEKLRFNKVIFNSLDCSVILYVTNKINGLLYYLIKELKFFFLVSDVLIMDYFLSPVNSFKSNVIDGLKIIVKKAYGNKCARCWHYDISVGKRSDFIDLCKRCIINLYGKGEKRFFI
ncbi:isoleucine--tRNA ligase [Candidatus Purcelliella pentastirinorum]|uniref:Isoleucine--tRNA ligase n=1 Tax=Candidatus Purcelliella pentastirinorum TaxID=472834 RepID=A0AAX3N8F7_9ENTR|nr:isoleucine--tRNA ligase [Candidatus Purcelliella pentastirinorum]WDI78668.1 isoleucine--tRNA ligase [Candidatus Purcelliella pentastirinorum]